MNAAKEFGTTNLYGFICYLVLDELLNRYMRGAFNL